MSRSRWIYKTDGSVIQVSDNYLPEPRSALIMGDISPYKSMITGEMIQGRRQHREHLKQHNCIEVGNEFATEKRAPVARGIDREFLRQQIRNQRRK